MLYSPILGGESDDPGGVLPGLHGLGALELLGSVQPLHLLLFMRPTAPQDKSAILGRRLPASESKEHYNQTTYYPVLHGLGALQLLRGAADF